MAKRKTLTDIMRMAKMYGVDKNALFVSVAKQYQLQQDVLDMIKKSLQETGETVTTKEYVKGRENVMVHPLIQQLPKHAEAANKTLTTMVDIIQRLGTKEPPGDKLGDFLGGE